MRRIAATVALVCAALAPFATPSGARTATPALPIAMPHFVVTTTPNTFASRVGFSQGSSLLWEPDAALAADLNGIAASGAHWVAVDFDWPSAEPARGTYDWSHIDRVVDAARIRHLAVLALAVYTPAWARPAGTTDKVPPDDPGDYAGFLHAATARYAPLGVHAWQIWNEPNVADFFAPAPDATRFARLVIAGGDAIHAVDGGAVVVAGGLAPATNVANRTIAPSTFLEEMYAAGAHGHFDALGVHPYSFPWAPMTPATWNTFFMLPWLHVEMAEHGDGNLPMWATEVGFGTGRDGQSVSEATQTLRVAEVVAAWHQLPFAGPLFFYNYRDLGASTSVWDHMGLARADGTAKPALRLLTVVLHATITAKARAWTMRVCVGGAGGGGTRVRRGGCRH